jgi:hypothetical protein
LTTLATYVLTTRQRVKDYASISNTNSDTAIDELINGASDFVRGYCGGRDFLSQDYVETYDTRRNHRKLFLKQYPATAVSDVSYRSGTPTNPIWVTYNADSYLKYLPEGYLYFYGFLPEIHQGIRISYTAGYLIDFTNEFDTTKHTLPFDLTMATTMIVALTLKSRNAQGVKMEMTEGQKIEYADGFALDKTTKNILSKYQTNHFAV